MAYAVACDSGNLRCEMIACVPASADDVVPFEQSRLLADRLSAVGGRVNLFALSGAGHDFDWRDDANTRLAARVTLAFLNEHLKGGAVKRYTVAGGEATERD